MNVTADGAAYYERVIKLLGDMDDAETSLSNASVLPRGRLRVDVPAPLARMILIPALPAFHARYPDIQLDMGVSDRMVDLIGESVDCVVRGGELTDLSLMARRVGDLRALVFTLRRAIWSVLGYLYTHKNYRFRLTTSSVSGGRAPGLDFLMPCTATVSVSPVKGVM